MLWLWHRLAATTPIQPLAWELIHAAGTALKRQKGKPDFEEKLYLKTDLGQSVALLTDQMLKGENDGLFLPSAPLTPLLTWQINARKDAFKNLHTNHEMMRHLPATAAAEDQAPLPTHASHFPQDLCLAQIR